MRSLDPKFRLGGLSLPEITRGVKMAAVRLEGVVTLNGRKLDPGPLVNAITLAWLRMPEPDRTMFLVNAVKELEALMAQDEEGPSGERGREAPERADVDVAHRPGKKESEGKVGRKPRG